MKIWCIKGTYMLKVVSSEKIQVLKGRPRCYAKSFTVQDVFRPIPVLGNWEMGTAVSCTLSATFTADTM